MPGYDATADFGVEYLGHTESRLTVAPPVVPVPAARRQIASGASA